MSVQLDRHMPSVYLTPTGNAGKVLENLRKQLSDTPSFQALTGLSATESLSKIYYNGIDKEYRWSPGRPAILGMFVIHEDSLDDNDFIYECTTAGTTGATEPVFPETAGVTVADNDVIWTAREMFGDNYPNSVERYSRPYAIVSIEEIARPQNGVGGGGNSFETEGGGMLTLFADVPSEYNNSLHNSGTWLNNLTDSIAKDLDELSGRPGYLNITNFDRVDWGLNPVSENAEMGIYGAVAWKLDFMGR